MANWIEGKVMAVTHFTDHLFSLTVQAEVAPFIPGQFTKLAMHIDGQRFARAYSYVNAPRDRNLEFYIARVEKGKLTPQLQQLQTNDPILLTHSAVGYFTLKEVPDSKILWLLATGTGIAPYLSMLQQGDNLSRFDKIVLVHAVRYRQDLNYLPLMKQLKIRFSAKLYVQPIISREHVSGTLHGRIPELIKNGALENAVNLPINAKQSHVMLCGNPDMITETQNLLKNDKHMNKNLRRTPGQFTSELYW